MRRHQSATANRFQAGEAGAKRTLANRHPVRGAPVQGRFEDAESHWNAARRAVGDDAERERGVPARRIGQSGRGRAERAQSRRRQDNSVPAREGCFESRRLLLACPVGGLEPDREDTPGGAVERLAAGQSARLVMQRQRGSRECRQQQHAEQRARAAGMSVRTRVIRR